MRTFILSSALLLVAAFAACDDPAQPGVDYTAAKPAFDGDDPDAPVVFVAPPTGDAATDVANIEAAVAAATQGAVIQFAEGTYAIEATTQFVVSVPGVTLQGDHEETTILGVTQPSDDFFLGVFFLDGGSQTVRYLTFDGFATAISLNGPGATLGGYLVEDNEFRNGGSGVEFVGFSDDVTMITDNEFDDLSFTFFIAGSTVHFTENRNRNDNLDVVPFGRPFNAGVLIPDVFAGNPCENNVFEENRVEGNADGIILVGFIGLPCRNNVIHYNRFIDQRVFSSGDNATLVWVIGGGAEANLIEENRLDGSEGIGIVVEGATGNLIRENEIDDLPGEKVTFSPFPGTGIFLDEGSSNNQVLENEFDDVVNEIVDLGVGNIIGQDNELSAAVQLNVARLLSAAQAGTAGENAKLEFILRRMQSAK